MNVLLKCKRIRDCVCTHYTICVPPLQLDDRVDWQKLKDVFKVVGPVLNIEFYRDNDGKAAIVQFDNPDTAVSAKCILFSLLR